MGNVKANTVNANELKQALYRVVFTAFIFLYLFVTNASIEALKFVTVYLSFGIISYAFLRFYKKESVNFRWLTLISDVAATSYGLYLTGAVGGIFLGVYLWLITGYGLRYGRSLLVGAYVLCIAGFMLAINLNTFWQGHPSITAGFLITLVLIPLHVYSLLNKLASATQKAEEASKAKSDFLSHISHEIRTPLNGVIGASQLLSDTELDSEQKELATIIVNSSTIVTDLISNVLDLSSIESGKLALNPTDTKLVDMAKNVVLLFNSQAKSKNIEMLYEFNCHENTIVNVDALRFKEVLLNLIGNAVKFTKTGSVTLKIDSLAINGSTQDFKFSVVDTGIGMEKESINTIFNSFTQADSTIKEKFGGTGLGVTISNNIVTLMGGKLEVESQLNEGTTFSFSLTLPVTNVNNYDELENVSPIAASRAIKNFTPIKILVADDNETNRIIIEKVLVAAGHNVTSVNDGDEALDALEVGRYDLMLLDSNMPKQNGIDVIKAHKAMNIGEKEIPAIIVSADAAIEKINLLLKEGASAYLTKPINATDLLTTIENTISNKSPSLAKVIPFKISAKNANKQYLNFNRLVELGSLDRDDDFLKNLIENFILDTEKRIGELKAAHHNNQYKDVKFISHTLAGSAASIGAQKLAEVASKMDKLNPASSSAMRSELFNETLDVFNISRKQLIDYEHKKIAN